MSRLVFFDFDNTLTVRDTSRPFARFLSDRLKKPSALIIFYVLLVNLKFGSISDKSFKRLFIQLFIKGLGLAEVGMLVRDFMETRLQPLLNKKVFEVLKTRVDQGDHVYIVSANFDFFLSGLKDKWGLKGVLATEVEVRDGRFTGEIIGPTCKGTEKINKIHRCLGDGALDDAIVYGDAEDAALYRRAKEGIDVTSKKRIREHV